MEVQRKLAHNIVSNDRQEDKEESMSLLRQKLRLNKIQARPHPRGKGKRK